ncbi:MAG TPA: exosortase/archaeosortase family protein [Verrucomicrobiae bacterium]|nr:exosortase/archaeosortase family protein [Verrucomicrobiae bacterium]
MKAELLHSFEIHSGNSDSRSGAVFRSSLLILPLLFLWTKLIHHLAIEWSLNPQYRAGWAVLPACLFLLWKQHGREQNKAPATQASSPLRLLVLAAVVLGVAYAAIRLVEEANPDWRLVSWALALDVIGLTILTLRIIRATTSRFPSVTQFKVPVFTLVLFLAAVPWPTIIEKPVVTALSRWVALGAADSLNLLGVPAMSHGNLVEVRSGCLGIDEACSGIQSLQSSVLVTLFFGEFFHLHISRRVVLLTAGVFCSLLLNVIRTGALAWVAANQGLKAMPGWHDPLGIMLPLIAFLVTWCIGLWLRGHKANGWNLCFGENRTPGFFEGLQVRTAIFPACLLIWIGLAELGTQMWYRSHERGLPTPASWNVRLPRELPGFQELPLPEASRQILRYDHGINAVWRENEGFHWQAIFLRWKPGRVAADLARNHTPEDCLAASGRSAIGDATTQIMCVHGFELPFRRYAFDSQDGPAYVFYCLWTDRALDRIFTSQWIGYSTRIDAVLNGERNLGQRSLELVLEGAETPEIAYQAVERLLGQIIRSGP